MRERSEIEEELKKSLEQHFSLREKPDFFPGKTKIPLSVPTYGWEEVWEALDSLLSTRVTMGEKVLRFEHLFADYIGVREAVMVNSGSSANLLVLSLLTNPATPNRIERGDEVITPAVTWATTVFPIINCGAIPVLVDVELDTLNIDPDEIERAITPQTRAIMLVHLLGNPCDMTRILEIAEKHQLLVIEDCCEAHGAEYQGRKVGSLGHLATFSFFFAHHISCIEGGMVLTNEERYAEMAKSLRVFGGVRALKDRERIARRYKHIDPRYLFVNTGYNLRPTEVQGAFGIHQMTRLEDFIAVRRENAKYWTQALSPYSDYLLLYEERKDTRHVWYGYPVTVKPGAPFTREELTSYLEERGVETRPIMAGNIAEQPAMRLFPYRKQGNLKNSRLIMRHSFFFGNHHGIGKKEREAVVSYIKEFFAQKGLEGRH